MTYSELAAALGVSVPAVKSLLVRARVGLAQALEARETACSEIHDELVLAHDRRVRPNATARRHMRDCAPCRQFHGEIRGMSKQFAALLPALGPFGLLANLLGIGGASGGGAAGGSAAAGAARAAGGAAGTGAATLCRGERLAPGGHVATLLAAAVVTAGGAVEIQHALSARRASRSRITQLQLVAVRQGPSSRAPLPTGASSPIRGQSRAAPPRPVDAIGATRGNAPGQRARCQPNSRQVGVPAPVTRRRRPGTAHRTSGGSPAPVRAPVPGSGTAVRMDPIRRPPDRREPGGGHSSSTGTGRRQPPPGPPTTSSARAPAPSGTSTDRVPADARAAHRRPAATVAPRRLSIPVRSDQRRLPAFRVSTR